MNDITLNNSQREQFHQNMKNNMEKILEFQAAFRILEIKNEIVRSLFEEAYAKVLSNHAFFASRDGRGIAKGERVLNDIDAYCLSDDDFNTYLDYAKEEMYKRGLTDAEGCYTEETNTENQLCELKRKIIRFAIDILPDGEMKETLYKAIKPGEQYSYKTYTKIFELFMQSGTDRKE